MGNSQALHVLNVAENAHPIEMVAGILDDVSLSVSCT